MRYFEITYYAGEEDFSTKSVLIDEPKFRAYQQAMLNDATHLMLEDRTIKMSSIKEVEPADDIVAEFVASGTPLSRLGLKNITTLAGRVEDKNGNRLRFEEMKNKVLS